MNLPDALYHLVHDYPGGVDALAARMHLAPSTLQSMANPNLPSHEWPLKRVLQAMTFTDDLRPLEALCSQFGGVFVRTAPMVEVADRDLYELATRLGTEFGDVVRSMSAALDKHGQGGARITPRELEAFDREVYELQACAAELRERLAKRCAAGAHLRQVKGAA